MKSKLDKLMKVFHPGQQSCSYTMEKITRDQRQLQPYCTGRDCLFVSRYIQLICLVRLLNIVDVNLSVMMTTGGDNLYV